jgi:hypothetical protein
MRLLLQVGMVRFEARLDDNLDEINAERLEEGSKSLTVRQFIESRALNHRTIRFHDEAVDLPVYVAAAHIETYRELDPVRDTGQAER